MCIYLTRERCVIICSRCVLPTRCDTERSWPIGEAFKICIIISYVNTMSNIIKLNFPFEPQLHAAARFQRVSCAYNIRSFIVSFV